MKRYLTAALCCLLLLGLCGIAAADQDFMFAEREYSVFEGETLQMELLRQGAALNAEVTWTSSAQKTASVDGNGLVTGRVKGNVTITAACKADGRNYRATTTIHVLRAVTEVTVNERGLTIYEPTDPLLAGRLLYEFEYPEDAETMPVLLLWVGQRTDIATSVLPKDASSSRCILAVDDEELVQVKNNSLTPQAVGETILTVYSQQNPEVGVRYHLYCVERVRSLAVNIDRKAIGVGASAQATAAFTPADATMQQVTWSTSTPKIISVSETGVITALARGNGRVKAVSVDGTNRSAEASISVQQMPTAITLTSKDSSVFVGGSIQINAAVEPKDANNKNVTWSSSDPSVATVKNGRVTGVGRGEVIITCASEADPAVMAFMSLTVGQQVTAIKPAERNVTVPVDGRIQLQWTVEPADANNTEVSFTSSSTRNATVEADGTVRGIARGESTITIKAKDGSNRSATVHVTVSQPPQSIDIKQDKVDIFTGNGTNLTATILPANTNNKKVIWTVENPGIATVSNNGRVNGVRAGVTTVTAACEEDPLLTDVCVVYVKQRVTGITVNPAQVSLKVGDSARIGWTVSPADATDQSVSFTSGKTQIATVDPDGTIHAHKRGETYITVKANDGSNKSARVKVSVIQPVTGVHMYKDEYVLDPDESLTIRAELEPSDASNTNMSWTSSDPTVATVNGKTNRPRVYGKAWGVTTVTGVTEDGGFVASTTIRVGTYRKALTITDFYTENNAPKIVVRNNSNMNITRFYFTITVLDNYDHPLVCTTDGDFLFSGHYLETLAEGRSTRHGRFHFDKYLQPSEEIGYMAIALTGYRCDDGFTYTYRQEDQPRKIFIGEHFVGSPVLDPEEGEGDDGD